MKILRDMIRFTVVLEDERRSADVMDDTDIEKRSLKTANRTLPPEVWMNLIQTGDKLDRIGIITMQ